MPGSPLSGLLRVNAQAFPAPSLPANLPQLELVLAASVQTTMQLCPSWFVKDCFEDTLYLGVNEFQLVRSQTPDHFFHLCKSV